MAIAIPTAAKNIDPTKSLRRQKKPDFVCEPGDKRVRKYGWTKSRFRGYLSIDGNTIWISSIWSIHMGKGNFSKLIRNLHNDGYTIKVPSPFPRMEAICNHMGFAKTSEFADEFGEMADVWVME